MRSVCTRKPLLLKPQLRLDVHLELPTLQFDFIQQDSSARNVLYAYFFYETEIEHCISAVNLFSCFMLMSFGNFHLMLMRDNAATTSMATIICPPFQVNILL